MTRSVHCLLVGTGAAAASDAIVQMETFVRARFGIEPVTLDRQRATEAEVMSALRTSAAACRPGGLFVLMFSGHGGFDDHSHFWQLSSGLLTDERLLEQIGHFDPDVEIFIVSDCCYGAGMLRPGLRSVTPSGAASPLALTESVRLELELRLTNRRRAFTASAATRLLKATASVDKSALPAPAPRGNVVLVAATDWLMVRTELENRFVRALCGAVPLAAQYSELRDKMISIMRPEGQSNWSVDAEPASALKRRPLVP